MAEFPDLGKHCCASDCKLLDFLPFECDGCKKTFCLDHRLPSTHNCVTNTQHDSHKKTSLSEMKPMKMCNFSNCKVPEHVLVTCSSCGMDFCLEHRHQQDHDCIKLPPANSTETKTAALVRSILESKNKEKTPKELSNRKPSSTINTKVQLMKLKAKALGLKTVPVDDRIYLELYLPNSSIGKPYFFSKMWTVGKLIDYVADAEKLNNLNNVPSAEKLKLFTKLSEEHLVMGKTLDDLLNEQVITNGQSVILKYVRPTI